jgi:lysophospholipid acyltransferase (LPLAT)-like uncharacterized protein
MLGGVVAKIGVFGRQKWPDVEFEQHTAGRLASGLIKTLGSGNVRGSVSITPRCGWIEVQRCSRADSRYFRRFKTFASFSPKEQI